MNQLRSILQSKVIRNNVFEQVREIHKVLFGRTPVSTYKQVIDSKSLQKYITYGINDMFIKEMQQLIELHRYIKDNNVNNKISLDYYFGRSILHNNIGIAKYLIQIANDHSDVVQLYNVEYDNTQNSPWSIQMMELILQAIIMIIEKNGDGDKKRTMNYSNICPVLNLQMLLGRDKDCRLHNPHLENVVRMADITKTRIIIKELPLDFESAELLEWMIKANVFSLQSSVLYNVMVKNQLDYQRLLLSDNRIGTPLLQNLFNQHEIPTLKSLKQLLVLNPTIEHGKRLFHDAFMSYHYTYYRDRNDEEGLLNYFNVLQWLLDNIQLFNNNMIWSNHTHIWELDYGSYIPRELIESVLQNNMLKVDNLIYSPALLDDVEYFKYIMDLPQSSSPEERIETYMNTIMPLGGFKIAKYIHQKYLVEMELDILFEAPPFT